MNAKYRRIAPAVKRGEMEPDYRFDCPVCSAFMKAATESIEGRLYTCPWCDSHLLLSLDVVESMKEGSE